MSAALVLEDVSVSFGGLVAVNGVTLTAGEGRVTGLIGPNGAGKTTTFNVCSGLIRPDAGRVRMHGEDVTRLSVSGRARRGLGRTFQRMELFDSLTVAENVRLGREAGQAGANLLHQVFARRRELNEVDDACRETLELCGISHLADRRVASLSTGQRRLVELARVLAGRFSVLLLDEPSSGLDHEETKAFSDILRRVVASRSAAMLLVEHDMRLVMGTCEYIYVLDFGKPIFEGTPADVQASEMVRSAYLGVGLS